jgi:hypothetical protein
VTRTAFGKQVCINGDCGCVFHHLPIPITKEALVVLLGSIQDGSLAENTRLAKRDFVAVRIFAIVAKARWAVAAFMRGITPEGLGSAACPNERLIQLGLGMSPGVF